MRTDAIQNIYNNGMASIVEDGGSVLQMLKNGGPYLLAATLFKGLEQQVYLTAPETVISYTSTALTGGYCIAGALAVFGMYKALDPHFTQLGYKKIEKVTITKQEFEQLKQEIDRLNVENADLTRRNNL
jgi:hypothetical protein